MTATMKRGTAWVTVRWQCDCGRWALWKATPHEMGRRGLDPPRYSQGRAVTQIGPPPVSAFDVLGSAKFRCLCGQQVPVVETFAALLRSGGPIFWEG